MLVGRAVGLAEGDPIQECQLKGRHDGDDHDQDEPAWTSTMFSAQTRTRPPRDTRDRVQRAAHQIELDFRTETNIVASHMSRRGWYGLKTETRWPLQEFGNLTLPSFTRATDDVPVSVNSVKVFVLKLSFGFLGVKSLPKVEPLEDGVAAGPGDFSSCLEYAMALTALLSCVGGGASSSCTGHSSLRALLGRRGGASSKEPLSVLDGAVDWESSSSYEMSS